MTHAYPSLTVEVASTVDRVAEELRRALFDGELAAGTPLREVALAESLGVSRPTVREALGVLVADGLAVREPHRGVSVVTPDLAAISDLSRARLVLESAGVRRWAEAGDEARDAVRSTLAAYTRAVTEQRSYAVLNELHLRFHLSLVALAGSERLVAAAETVYAELRLALAQVDRVRRDAHAQPESHLRILTPLEAGDLEAAEAQLCTHLADAEAAIRGALSEVAPKLGP
ncbi:GntR family transcriptional regulator [Nocardioides limicola]|uniref:GntR family transcriptional regulator n=1 Tax=Nocardioides limicola TaxID=2803368 RepID=UPI00193B2EFA|nr:GntR family transcriptional regulator [Nocardioides sp. DJM-14]